MHNTLRLIRMLPDYRGRFAKVLFANTLLGLTAVVVPLIFRSVVNTVVETTSQHGSVSVATASVLAAVGLLLLLRVVSAGGFYLQERASDLLFLESMWGLREKIFAFLSQLSIEYYERTRVGEIMQRFGNSTQELRNFLQQFAESSLLSVLNILFILVLLLIHLPVIGLLMTITVPGLLLIAWSRVRRTRPLQREWQRQGERAMGIAQETLSLVMTTRSFNQEPVRNKLFREQVVLFKEARTRQFRIEWSLNFVQTLSVGVISTFALAIVALGTLHGQYRAGDILLVYIYVQQLVQNVNPVARLIISAGEVEIAAERITEILDEKNLVVNYPGATELTSIESIEFDHVSFKYPNKTRLVLDEISFKLHKGETLALVGPSGVGKTTITKLLLRFYEPTSGFILINGQLVDTYTQESVRQQIGMVMQDVALFNDSIGENLRFANPAASPAQLREAARLAHADVFIDKLPEKYDSLVGERGIKLSGGEKQRVAIARAILRDPNLVILDEATSALDSESERSVQDGLKRLMAGKTAVIIAHRLSTIMQADQIIVLQDGKITERGDHAKLANKKSGLYARLYKLQTEGAIV